MKRIEKKNDSEVLKKKLSYRTGGNNSSLKELLLAEQQGFCVYTEKHLHALDSQDIDHFNPKLKDTTSDTYENWYVCLHKWNQKKSDKWDNYQPVINPSDSKLETDLIMRSFFYESASNDQSVENLIELLSLNDPDLISERKKYVQRIKDLADSWMPGKVDSYLRSNPTEIQFRTALSQEFGEAWVSSLGI